MTTWPQGYGRVVREDVDSTLDEARRIRTDHAGPFWLLAHRQTAGRGRRGRAWDMPAGNFAATLVLPTTDPPARAALRSFVVSLALHRAFADATANVDAFTLKWPNDVLLNGGKVAGILLETLSAPTGLAIGVGVNLIARPDAKALEKGAVAPVSVLEETGTRVEPEAFLDCLAHHYAELELQFQTFGFEPIRAGWLAHAARLGETITARTGREETIGTFEDVDLSGQLVLRGARGVTHIAAADVYF